MVGWLSRRVCWVRDVCHARVFEGKDEVDGDVCTVQDGGLGWVDGLGAAGNVEGFEVEVLLMLNPVRIEVEGRGAVVPFGRLG